MQYKTIINGVNFTPYIKADGVRQAEVRRQSRSVIGLDGTMYRSDIVKRVLTLQMMSLRGSAKDRLMAALTSPATVEYTDLDRGDITRVFYITSLSGGVKTVQGGNTYWGGISITLEEK